MADKPDTELRLALAMRGGVSLAVWIGGAVAEIDLARRASPDVPDSPSPGQQFWKELLEISGYRSVVADVLAGASAGGLNGVLYAASQVYDFDYDRMRATWLEVGDTQQLVRSRRSRFLPSMFLGDRYFAPQVERALRCSVPNVPDETRPHGPRVQLDLAATCLEAITRPVPSPSDQQLRDRRHAGGFRFRNPEEEWLSSSFSPRSADKRAVALWRLAVAARATSAFPAAFEAAEIVSSRRLTFGAPGPETEASRQVEFDGSFLDRTADRAPFAVSDGGILDNIPIGRALDAASRAPASGPTERKLIYLQPGSTGGADDPASTGSRTSTVAVVKGALASRMTGETINADIDALESHNESVRRAQALRLGSFAGIDDRASLLTTARASWAAYVATRASADAARLAALLRDPLGTLGYDPFPRAIGVNEVPDDRWRSPLGGWAAAEREELGSGLHYLLHGALRTVSPPASPDALLATHDPEPLLRIAVLLLEWARYLEARDVDVGAEKRALYCVRAFVEEALVGAAQQLWVATAARAGTDTMAAYVEAMTANLPQLWIVDLAPDAMAAALLRDSPEVLRGELRESYVRIDEILAGTAAPGRTNLLEVLVGVLVHLAGALAGTTAPERPDEPKLQAGAALDRALRGLGDLDASALAALEVVCLPEFVAGLPGRRRIDFHRCSSENRTPAAWWFTAVHEEVDREAGAPPPGRLHSHRVPVERKLAGNELGNFSAFLLPEWRANDWMWGRLDAAVTLGDLLVRPKPLAEWLATEGDTVDQWLDALRLRVRGPDTPWAAAVVAEIWDETAIRTELDALAGAHAAGEGIEDVTIPVIRDTFVARRQWDILREERVSSAPSAGDFAEVKGWVGAYAVGDETLHTSHDRDGLRRRVADIVVSATRSVVWNLERGGAPIKSPWLLTGLLWRFGRPAGWLAGRLATTPRETTPAATSAHDTPPKEKGALGKVLPWLVPIAWVAIIAGLTALLGWRGAAPWLFGVVVAPAVLVVVLAAWLWLVARRVESSLRDDDDVPPDPPEASACRP